MAALREVLARFGVSFDDSQLKKGDKAVDGVTAKLQKLGAFLAGGLIVKKLKDMVFGLADQADALAKQSAALGLSITELQSWQHAAGLSGVASEELANSIARLQKSSSDAAKGTGAAADTFRKLGVSVKNTDGTMKSADQLMTDVGGAIGAMKNPTERTAAAMNIFGRSGAKLIPLFASGAEGIAKMRAEVQELGGGFDPEFAKNAEAMNDSISRLNMAWLSFKVRVGGLVIPLINRLVMVATKVTAGISKFAGEGDRLKAIFVTLGAAALVLGRSMLVAGARAIAPWLPIIATLGLVYLLVDELITLWQGGDTLIGRAIDRIFGEGSAKKAVAWVKDVVDSTKRLFTDTHRALAEFDAGLSLIWFDFTTWLDQLWKETWVGLQLIVFDAFSAMEGAIASIQDGFASLWNGVIDGAKAALGIVNKVLDAVPGARAAAKVLAPGLSDVARNAPGLLAGASLSTSNRADQDATYQRHRRTLIGMADADQAAIARQRAMIIDRANVPARPGAVDASTNINITVPPGTPSQQVQAIKEVVVHGTRRGNRATKNALAFTAEK